MKNPLKNVPLNTKRVYVMAKTHFGCEVYMPVDSDNDSYISQHKIDLQNFLNTQPIPPELPNDPRVA